jgi:hypothetical protein
MQEIFLPCSDETIMSPHVVLATSAPSSGRITKLGGSFCAVGADNARLNKHDTTAAALMKDMTIHTHRATNGSEQNGS